MGYKKEKSGEWGGGGGDSNYEEVYMMFACTIQLEIYQTFNIIKAKAANDN